MIPTGQLVPLFAVTFDSTAAQTGPALLRYKAMLMGQKLTAPASWAGQHAYGVGEIVKPTTANGHWYICIAADTSDVGEPTWPTASKGQVTEYGGVVWQEFPAPTSANLVVNQIASADQAAAKYGFGSPIHIMARGFKTNNTATQLFAISAADAEGGAAAEGSIVIEGTADAAGTLSCYIDGTRIAIAVAAEDTAADIALALALAINNTYSLPVWATIDSSYENIGGDTITLTAKVKGTVGNDVDIRFNYYTDSESYPSGITTTITDMADGVTNPDFYDLIEALGDTWYQMFVGPYTDSTSMVSIETELARRAQYNKKIYGQYITAIRGDDSAQEAWSANRNSQWVLCASAYKEPMSPGEKAAAIAAQVAPEASRDPAIPMKTLPLYGILPAIVSDRFNDDINNNLLNAGISTTFVDDGGVVRIQQLVTMYRKSPAGADDTAWQSANTVYCNIYTAYDFVNSLALKYPRAKLIDDGVKVSSGQSIITPKTGKAFAIEKYEQWAYLGIVENVDTFKAQVICQRSTTNRRTLEWLLPTDLANQFDNADVTIQFRV
jgi:phage tail sheath gpL-like